MSAPEGFKPNLAATLTKPELIQYPVFASPKIDGVRCVIFRGVAYSRSLKPIPNQYIQAWAAKYAIALEGLDGELVVGSPSAQDCMRQTTHGVMARAGEPEFTFYAFDIVSSEPFKDRRHTLFERHQATLHAIPHHEVLLGNLLTGSEALERFEDQMLGRGFEGVMIRNPDSLYKFGRSSEQEGRGKVKTQGGLVKVKRFQDAEAVVIGFEEEMHNANVAKKDAFGRTERSTHKAQMHGKGILGVLIGLNADGQEVRCAGFKAEDKVTFWQSRHLLLGRPFTYKYFPHGEKDKPRHPTFKAFRAAEDISE